MRILHRCRRKARSLSARASSLLLLFQRAPLVKMLFPEAKLLADAGLGEATKWVIATFAGLGAYDTVAGATTISQVQPTSGSTTVNTTVGANLSFVYQLTGSPFNSNAGGWSTTTLPGGLVHTAVAGNPPTVDSITGTPTTPGTYSVTVTVFDRNFPGNFNASKTFSIVVAPAIITQQPASAFVAKGTSASLSVGLAPGAAATYQWYRGNSPNTSDPITGATSATYTSPALNASINYWVKVTRSGTVANSNTASITVGVAPAITTQPTAATTINSGASTTLTVAASGDSPTYQWYQGTAGDTTTPVSGATSTSFTTPALTASTSYWVKVTNSFGTANSQTAAITVNVPAPQITTQPAATTITSGSTATLSVTATGDTPAYQWYQGDSGVTTTPVAGATSASFTTPALTADTSYWVRVRNAGGHVDSSAALVTVTPLDPVVQWKASLFSEAQLADPAISGDAADPDGDGIKNSDEYLFGTSPLANDKALLNASFASGQVSVTFVAKLATGAGYSGKTRHYALQSATDLSGTWTPVTGFEDITGNDQVATYTAASSTVRRFFRLSVTLTP